MKKVPTQPPPMRLICKLESSTQLGRERISKLALEHMKRSGIDTGKYKAHSLRGATATTMLALGVPMHVVQARGGWASEANFNFHYARMHQRVDFDAVISTSIIRRSGIEEDAPRPREPGLREAFGAFSMETSLESRNEDGRRFPRKAPNDSDAGRARIDRTVDVPTSDGCFVLRQRQCCGCKRNIIYEPCTQCEHCQEGKRHLRCDPPPPLPPP
eukprot:TRINITY_DN3850_c0_g1_i15.p2 TRINITY_DN3850_c0_g1~~TRINITY_DN3850_c0_g1_i15.p2  ORF type:complete len:215 (+),score=23.17 TRINITY_DN3850_c0_g1_i15:739-1383(+)